MNLPSNVVAINESSCGLSRIVCRIFDCFCPWSCLLDFADQNQQKCEKESSVSSSRFLSRHMQIFSHQTEGTLHSFMIGRIKVNFESINDMYQFRIKNIARNFSSEIQSLKIDLFTYKICFHEIWIFPLFRSFIA